MTASFSWNCVDSFVISIYFGDALINFLLSIPCILLVCGGVTEEPGVMFFAFLPILHMAGLEAKRTNSCGQLSAELEMLLENSEQASWTCRPAAAF